MMAWIGSVLSALAIGLLMGIHVGAVAEPQETVRAACPAILIDGQAVSSKQRAHLCDGAAKARDFFRSHGIDLKETIRVTIRDSDRAVEPAHIGCYSPGRKAIEMLSLEQALSPREANTVFGLPIDEALYQSVVVHEIAHAIADQHFAMPAPSLVAQEYLAYAAQLSTMASQTRRRVLTRYEVAPYADVEEMSSIYYAMAPDQFGVKAYLHFDTLTDPGSFLRGLLSGSIRPERAEAQ